MARRRGPLENLVMLIVGVDAETMGDTYLFVRDAEKCC